MEGNRVKIFKVAAPVEFSDSLLSSDYEILNSSLESSLSATSHSADSGIELRPISGQYFCDIFYRFVSQNMNSGKSKLTCRKYCLMTKLLVNTFWK